MSFKDIVTCSHSQLESIASNLPKSKGTAIWLGIICQGSSLCGGESIQFGSLCVWPNDWECTLTVGPKILIDICTLDTTRYTHINKERNEKKINSNFVFETSKIKNFYVYIRWSPGKVSKCVYSWPPSKRPFDCWAELIKVRRVILEAQLFLIEHLPL